MRFKRFIVTYLQRSVCWSSNALSHAFCQSFKELGYDSIVHVAVASEPSPMPIELSANDCIFCVGWSVFVAKRHKSWSKAGGVILYNVIENSGLYIDSLKVFKARFRVFKENLPTPLIAIFNHIPNGSPMGVKSTWCPLGFHEAFKIKKPFVQLTDSCVFLGTVRRHGGKHRVEVLGRIGGKFHVNVERGHRRHGALDRILSSKIWLNIHRDLKMDNFRDIATFRWAIPNGLVVLNEESSWQPPFAQWVHWASATTEEFPDIIDFLFKNDHLRSKMAVSAYEFSKKYWHLRDHLKRALSEIENQ